MAVEAIPTGSLALDIALGVGGVPRGRIIEIFGPESSGKTTLVLHVDRQRPAAWAAWPPSSTPSTPSIRRCAQALGVDLDELLVSQPGTGEEALEIAEMLVRSNAVDVIVIDSVAALVPRAEIEGEIGDTHVGLQARLMSQALRKLTGAITAAKTVADLHQPDSREDRRHVRQPRDDARRPGAEVLRSCGSTSAGSATIKEGEEAIGSRVKVQGGQEQGRPAVPRRRVRHDVQRRHLAARATCSTWPSTTSCVEKTGAWFNYGDMRLGQGRENAREFLKRNPEIATKIEDEIRNKVASIDVGVEGISEAE